MFDFFRAWRGLKIPVILLFGSLILGTFGFKAFFPDETFLRLLYMAGITLTTVGYGDILGIDENPAAIIYTTFLMFTGMGVVLYSTSVVTAYIIEGNLKNAFSFERVRRRIKRMENHFIICGAGETGVHVIREMVAADQECVVIETTEEKKQEINFEFPDVPVLVGDATTDLILEKAGISRARGLVAALSNDKDNLFLTVSAKMLQPRLTIVSKAIDLTMIKKLKRAGASRVVSPNYIGGMRMASEILRPHVTNFLDRMLRGTDKSIRVEEVVIPKESSLVGKKIGEVDFYSNCGLNILALGRGGDHFQYNPGPEIELSSGDVLLYIGTGEQEKLLDKLVSK